MNGPAKQTSRTYSTNNLIMGQSSLNISSQIGPSNQLSSASSRVSPAPSHLSPAERPLSFASSINSSDTPFQPPGTMMPGTTLSINGYSIIIEKFLAEGFLMLIYFNFFIKRRICACIPGQ